VNPTRMAVILVFSLTLLTRLPALDLVVGGQPRATLVTPDQPTAAEQFAA